MNVLILEDNIEINNHFTKLVKKAFEKVVVEQAFNGKQAIDICKNSQLDLMILDIELDDKNTVTGLDYANMISCIQKEIDFIVISGHGEYKDNRTNINPYYYFLKPVQGDELIAKLRDWHSIRFASKTKSQSLQLETEKGLTMVPLKNIIYLEKRRKRVCVRTITKEYTSKTSLRKIAGQLNNDFYNTHQSFFVNMRQIEKLEVNKNRSWHISFRSLDEEALLSRYKAKEFFEVFKSIN